MNPHYECQRCGACCRWPGEVRVSDEEIARMAEFLDLNTDDFIQQFTRLNLLRSGLSLAEQPDGACILLTGNDCRVHPVKPEQCRTFPRDWQNLVFQDRCRAIPRPTPSAIS